MKRSIGLVGVICLISLFLGAGVCGAAERYKPEVIFSDGEWDMPSKDWRSEELLAWLFNESPVGENVVIDDRWGKDSRHKHGGTTRPNTGPGEKLVVKDVEISPNAIVTMLGLAQSIRWDRSGSDVTIHVPALSVDEVPCQYAYVFRITQVK